MSPSDVRTLTEEESLLLGFMLAVEAPGMDVLRGQVSGLRAYRDCECPCPSIALIVREDADMSTLGAKFATIHSGDIDRSLILFVTDGRLSALECAFFEDARDEWPSIADLVSPTLAK